MRGIIFRTYLSLLTNRFGYEVTDSILLKRDYPNKGGFSSAGNYDVLYLEWLISDGAYLFDNSKDKVWIDFGEYALVHLIKAAKRAHASEGLIANAVNLYDFLENINIIHHEELNKLYPDAKFPSFDIQRVNPRRITIGYSSDHHYPYFVYGLLRGCIEHFNDSSTVTMKRMDALISSPDKHASAYQFEVFGDE